MARSYWALENLIQLYRQNPYVVGDLRISLDTWDLNIREPDAVQILSFLVSLHMPTGLLYPNNQTAEFGDEITFAHGGTGLWYMSDERFLSACEYLKKEGIIEFECGEQQVIGISKLGEPVLDLRPYSVRLVKDRFLEISADYRVKIRDEESEREALREYEERKRREARQGYIYVVKGGEYCKIGMSKKPPPERVAQFAPKLPFSTEIISEIPVADRYKVEKELHEKFKDKRTHGEWFKLSEEDLAFLATMESRAKGDSLTI